MDNTTSHTVNKRGRKPKSQIIPIFKSYENTDAPIIAHLPIDYSDIINEENNEIFINPESFLNSKEQPINTTELTVLYSKIDELTEKIKKYEKINKPVVQSFNNMSESKCWWDAHNYSTPSIELPEHYFHGMFHCIGKFCSYNCAMAYNIDINDESISKRNSLLYLHYKKTYNKDTIINPAPSWKILKDFGGTVDIDEFRNNFTTNTMNYLYIKPPLVSRISYVEKTPVNQIVEVLKPNDLILKRNKPLNSTKYTLESTIGLKKIITKTI
jgi:hypothetical protein